MSRAKAAPCTRCGTPCHGQTGLCKDCYGLIPARERSGTSGQFQPRPTHLKTGTTSSVNAKERNFDSPLSRREQADAAKAAKKAAEEAAKVKRLIEQRAKDAADRADLNKTIFGTDK